VQALREAARAGPLGVDPELGELAQSIARDLSEGRLSEARVGKPAEKALPKMDRRYRQLHTVLTVTTDIKALSSSPSLVDPRVRAIGLGVMPARADEKRRPAGAVYVVMVLAEPVPATGR
jgi:hypothetical protein